MEPELFSERNGCNMFYPLKFNSSPLKSYLPNRKVVFQPPLLRGYVKLQGCTYLIWDIHPFSFNKINKSCSIKVPSKFHQTKFILPEEICYCTTKRILYIIRHHATGGTASGWISRKPVIWRGRGATGYLGMLTLWPEPELQLHEFWWSTHFNRPFCVDVFLLCVIVTNGCGDRGKFSTWIRGVSRMLTSGYCNYAEFPQTCFKKNIYPDTQCMAYLPTFTP